MSILLMTFLFIFQYSLNDCRREIWAKVNEISVEKKSYWLIFSYFEVSLDMDIYEKVFAKDGETDTTQKYTIDNIKHSEDLDCNPTDCPIYFNFEFKQDSQSSPEPDKQQEPSKQIINFKPELNKKEISNDKYTYSSEEEMVAHNYQDCDNANTHHYRFETINIEEEDENKIQEESTSINISLKINETLSKPKRVIPKKKVYFDPIVDVQRYEPASDPNKTSSNTLKMYLSQKPMVIEGRNFSFFTFEDIKNDGTVNSNIRRKKNKYIAHLKKLKEALNSDEFKKNDCKLVEQDENNSNTHEPKTISSEDTSCEECISQDDKSFDSESSESKPLKPDTKSYWYSTAGVKLFEEKNKDKYEGYKVIYFNSITGKFCIDDDKNWVLNRVDETLKSLEKVKRIVI